MATWVVKLVDDGVTLTYTGDDGIRQTCGKSETVLLSDVIAFASDQADPYDRVVLPSGVVLVRQRTPALRV